MTHIWASKCYITQLPLQKPVGAVPCPEGGVRQNREESKQEDTWRQVEEGKAATSALRALVPFTTTVEPSGLTHVYVMETWWTWSTLVYVRQQLV